MNEPITKGTLQQILKLMSCPENTPVMFMFDARQYQAMQVSESQDMYGTPVIVIEWMEAYRE